MRMRLLKRSDIRVAISIVARNYPKTFARTSGFELKDMFTKGPVRPVYFVAEEEGKVLGLAGYVQSWMDWDVYEIFWVNVLPGRQRQGIGKELTEKIISEIRKKKDASLILLSATPINAKYYKDNFNFKVIGPSSKGYSLMGLSLLSEND